jgi:hypothetical protein
LPAQEKTGFWVSFDAQFIYDKVTSPPSTQVKYHKQIIELLTTELDELNVELEDFKISLAEMYAPFPYLTEARRQLQSTFKLPEVQRVKKFGNRYVKSRLSPI